MKRTAQQYRARENKRREENYRTQQESEHKKQQQKDYVKGKRKAYRKSKQQQQSPKDKNKYIELEQDNLNNLDVIKLFESFIVL